MLSSSAATAAVLEDDLPLEPTRQEIQEQLERIAGSSLFRNSKRYPSLLRYIVDEVLAGRHDQLKERTLGVCVFGRSLDYDTNADPVVRISAGEVRKRIAQYYQAPGHETELRIEIPLGSYQPRFYRPDDQTRHAASPSRFAAELRNAEFLEPPPLVEPLSAPPLPSPAAGVVPAAVHQPRLRSHQHIALLYVLLVCLAITWGVMRWRAAAEQPLHPGVALFWSPLLRSPAAPLIVLGVHTFDAQGRDISYRSHVSLPQTDESLLSAMTRSDMIHLSDLTSYAKLTTLLTQHHHAFRTQGAPDTTLEQLRAGPFILIGGFNNLWTTKLTSQLRFRFVTFASGTNGIEDSQHPGRIWTVDTTQSALSNTRDYAIVSRFLDPTTDQYILIAAGVGKSGTEAASDFLTNEAELATWLESTKTQTGENVQIVLSTDVIEGKHGAPHVIDVYRW